MADESGEWFWEHNWFAAEVDADVVAGVDLIEGEAADRGWPLGVEQNQQTGHPMLGLDGVVVQQPAGLFPTGLGVDDPAGPPHLMAAKSSWVSFCLRAQRIRPSRVRADHLARGEAVQPDPRQTGAA
ncbi:hypothetical protein [Amycolatopsis sp. cmx-11-12]|uniref:hypothetical protein n=1 Tax=Amycolatopsis sp. cmx-11-12 TaxID=2785795 RepID=UPI0039184D82